MPVTYDVAVTMRDGVRLSADIYLPDEGGPFPVILQRTPYNNNSKGVVMEAEFYVAQGYAYVAQDCRGKFDSDGQWYPYRNEAADGDDTLTWCATQPWSTGRVGMSGGSYCGAVQWYAAATGNPALKCIVPLVAYSDLFFDHGLRRDGVFQTFYIYWTAAMAGRVFFELDRQKSQDVIWHVPLAEMDQFLGFDLLHWKDFTAHDCYDDFWRGLSVREKYAAIDVPALNVGGWHSPWELQGTLTHFVEMTAASKSEEMRRNQRLIVGPWTHSVNLSQRVGEIDFGLQAIIDLQQIQLRWYDRWLKDEENGVDDEPSVLIYVMGDNAWREEAAWPVARAVPTPFYLRSGGRANSRFGDGLLSPHAPEGEEPTDSFSYNPERPVPSLITETGDDENLYSDQRAMERRDDVLVYTTEPLTEEVEVTGPISVKLFAATSARDTDFTAMLIDVQPDGYAKPVVWGIARGRYLSSFTDPQLLEPNRVYEWTINLWATSNVFKQGHRIRLDISSSFFPFFGRNHNTGNPPASDIEFVIAEQTIHHSSHYSSHILLPIVAAKDEPEKQSGESNGSGDVSRGVAAEDGTLDGIG